MTTPADPAPEPGSPSGSPDDSTPAPGYSGAGAQTPSYGAPGYGTPSYGAPGYGAGGPAFSPAPPPPPPQSKTMAIWSLVLAVIVCLPVSVVLAIIVLVRGRGHGRGLATAALVINALWGLVVVGGIVAGVLVTVNNDISSTQDLTTGTCITASGLTGTEGTVADLQEAPCEASHDGEVLGTTVLTDDTALDFDDKSVRRLCREALALDRAAINDLFARGFDIIGLTRAIPPSAGDKLSCVGYRVDGATLTGRILGGVSS